MIDDSELRRRLNLLRERLDEGKIKIAKPLAAGVEESFRKVRYGEDGQIDLATVDGRIRSMAMVVTMMQDREETKQAASLAEIQEAYFSRITPMFAGVHKLMLEHSQHPQSNFVGSFARPRTCREKLSANRTVCNGVSGILGRDV